MDFIGNLLNQMSSAFNQETAIPKKEEISMDETLKWRALKNNQFASRTRGGAAAAAAVGTTVVVPSGGTRSGSSIGRSRSTGGTVSQGGTSNGQRKQHPKRASSENSNDSIGGDGSLVDGLLDGLAADGEETDGPEEDIEIEIAKDISGEELQEALALSQLLEADPMEVGTMEEEELVAPEVKKDHKGELRGGQTVIDSKDTLVQEDEKKVDTKMSETGQGKSVSGNEKAPSTNDAADEKKKKQENEVKKVEEAQKEPKGNDSANGGNDREDVGDDRDKKLPSNGISIPATSSSNDATSGDRLTEGGKKMETDRTPSTEPGDKAIDAIDDVEDDDDDVLIISTGEMVDVVEVAETSKEDEDDDEVLEVLQKCLDGEGSAAVAVEQEVSKKQQQTLVAESEEKYHPSRRADVGESNGNKTAAEVEQQEAKFSPTLENATGRAAKEDQSPNDEKKAEEKPPLSRKDKSPKRDGNETSVKEDHVADADVPTKGASLLVPVVGGRTTRSKKTVGSVGTTSSSPSPSTPAVTVTPLQRRSQRFQGKEPDSEGRKSTDVKLNGDRETAIAAVVVKEEEPDEGKKKTAIAGSVTGGPVKGSTKTPAVAPTSVERRSDRSLRSRQQSTSSGSGVVGSGQPASVVTRRSSETAKAVVPVELDSNEPAETIADREMPRRGRKRLSHDPPAPTVDGPASSREKTVRVPTPAAKEENDPSAVSSTEQGFPLDPGENDSGGAQEEQLQPAQPSASAPPAPPPPPPSQAQQVAPAAGGVQQRRGRKRRQPNAPEPSGGSTSGGASSSSPEKPPPYKRAARVSRDGSDGILASALARRDKVDSQGRLSRPIKLSAKMLANEELRHGFEQHNNGRIIIGSDTTGSSSVGGHADEPEVDDKSRKRQSDMQPEAQASKEPVNLPAANSAISSSSEDVTVVSVTYPSPKAGSSGKGSQNLASFGKSLGRKPTDSSTERQRATKPVSGSQPKKMPGAPTAASPDVQTFLQGIRTSRICINRSPEENRKLNRRQTKRLAKQKEKHMLALGLQRKGAVQPAVVRNGVTRRSPAEEDDEILLSEPEPESESSGSEADFVPSQKIGTVGKPSVTLRLRKPETLLDEPGPSTSKQRSKQPPLVTVPSAMVKGPAVASGRQQQQQQQKQQTQVAAPRQQGTSKQQQATTSKMPANAPNSRRSVVLPAAMTTATTQARSSSSTAQNAAAALRKDKETEQLQRSLERFGCELTLIPTSTPSAASDGRSSAPSTSQTNRKRTKEQTTQQRTPPVRSNQLAQVSSSSSSSAATATAAHGTTSPSLQIVLEKRPQSSAGSSSKHHNRTATTPSSSIGSPPSAAAATRQLLCLCRQMSDIFVASSVGTGYCTAVDDIDGQLIGCCNELSDELVHMLRPSPTVSFQLLCNLHRKRLEDHSCCAICGVYCTQGNFAMCKNAHIFHPDCAVKYILNAPFDPTRPTDRTAPTLVLQCPHCAQECPNGEIQVTVQLTTPPVLLPSRKNIVKPAKMAIGKSKATTNGGSTAKDAFRANVDSFVPSRVRNMLTTGGKGTVGATNGHDPRKANQGGAGGGNAAAGGSGTASKNHYSTKSIFEAIHSDNVDRITEIIISGFDIETRFRDFHDGTCLHLVSNFGSIGMAYLIICRAQSVDFLNILDRELRTALMCAVLGAKLDIIKLLLECGADVTVKGPDGMTVLHLAAKLGQHEAVRMILEWGRKRLTARDLLAFVNGVDNGSYTALVWAAENRYKETIQLLLASGADVNICDKENNTALHWAAMAGCSDSMHLLLKKGCDPNVQNINGDTPLHLACRHGFGEICIMLLTMGASLNARNTSDELPQDMLQNPNSECASIIAANVKMFSLGKNTKETRILCSDISNGREYYPVQVVHTAGRNDRQQTVPTFKYIQKSVQLECRIDTNLSDMIVCTCKDSCASTDSSCLCSERTWYTEEGRLVNDFDFLEPPTIVECGDLCDCNQQLCRNRVVQRGLRVPLQLFYSPGKAWGVRTLVPIPKGTFLVEYVGELLTDDVANQRPDDTYFFDLNSGFCIDANAYGNVSRFFNHSCDPNVSPVSVFYEHQDKRFPKVAMFACRDIKAQEEICFNYGEKFWVVKNRTMSCLCKSSECRYRTVQQQGVLV
ncbi:mediator of DNA damage checkpoint protein 1 [Anopheles ziemanni]|uniref:mediator of DNA damage checkpoint protein 1 n=1 Tax=Anopheles ziemanni TaxID=345580 RepID=UPI00265E9515|nr:mediator of DNA damage checkpoint protein 1 [Anopheles ziemanni]